MPESDIRAIGEEEFSFDAAVHYISDLTEGIVLPGIVTNVTVFVAAFVDVGVHINKTVLSISSNSLTVLLRIRPKWSR